MATGGSEPVIKIVRKKSGHGGHHGGSWKVAYADFVTAMMAFFLVLWIIGLDQPSKQMTQAYFNDPVQFMREYKKDPAGFVRLYRGGNNPLGKGSQAASRPAPTAGEQTKQDAGRKKLETTRRDIQNALDASPDFRDLKKHVDISITSEGLKIELLEARDSLFFRSGSADVEPRAQRLLALVARKLAPLGNPVAVEGHTDVVPYKGRTNYSNWELSADRANAARRVMEASGLSSKKIAQVRGFADKMLRDPVHPAAATNRRVSILVASGG